MASATERTDRDGQQVMSAQGQSPTQASRVAEDGARLEGETAGPDYARTAATVHGVEPALQLPNGTGPQASPRTADHSPGIQSLPYSPVALRQSRGPQATYGGFFQEAWPTQPQEGMEPTRFQAGDRSSGNQLGVQGWMLRLGEFFRAQMAATGTTETRTTVTRQRLVGSRGSGGLLMQQEQVHHTTSQPASPQPSQQPQKPQLSSSTSVALTRADAERAYPETATDPPLFGPGARRVMDDWPRQAPLLHPPSAGPGTDVDSAGSIPKEMVQEEVRRQVQAALESQSLSLEQLREENRDLRQRLSQQSMEHGVPEGHQQPKALGHGVPEGHQQPALGHGVPEGHQQLTLGHGVPGGHQQLTLGHGVPGGHQQQSALGHGVPGGHQQPALGHGVPEGHQQLTLGHGVPGGHQQQSALGHGVPGGHQQQSALGHGVPGGHHQQSALGHGVPGGHQHGHGVPGGHQHGHGVPGGHQHGHGVPGGHQLGHGVLQGTNLDVDVQGVTSRWSSSRGAGDPGGVKNRSRSASADRRLQGVTSSTTRVASASPKTRNLSGGDQGRLQLSQGSGFLSGSRERGGMFDVPPVDVAYRPPEFQRGATFGDYDYEMGGNGPPGLVGHGGALGGGPITMRAEGPDPQLGQDAPDPSALPSATAAPATEAPTTSPSPMDVLITGMTQLQQVLLRQKPEGLDLEPKAVQELAKLPDYAPETGAIDFQDFLYLAEQQIGSLASGAGEWWSRTLLVAQESYAEYQSVSPMRRLTVKPMLTSELKEERYRKLERKVAALLLAALPKSVREEMIAYRVQGTHQILFRLMIVYQPGGAQDRAQLLRQLDVSESAAGPTEAIASLRRWYRLLQRAADIGVKLPDESIQTRSLTMIVKKTAESFPDFKFRMALARTELQIDTRPTQDNVMRYLQHLLAELEHLGGSKKPTATAGATSAVPTTTAATTTLKGLQTPSDAAPRAKAKSVAEKPCKYFATDDGCRRGKECTYLHAWDGLQRSDRCLLCGSTKHRMKECPARKSSPSDKAGRATVAKAQGTAGSTSTSSSVPLYKSPPQPPPGIEASAATAATGTAPMAPSTSSATVSSLDTAQVTEILNETNKVLKALSASKAAPAAPTSPPTSASATLDPLAMIQQQINEIRGLRALVVKADVGENVSFQSVVSMYEARLQSSSVALGQGESEALLDSGATHPLRCPSSQQEWDQAQGVTVSLATGEETTLKQNPGGTLLNEDLESSPILPMGQLVTLLGCSVHWTPSRLVVQHPVHGKLRVRMKGFCPVLPVSQALELISELEAARLKRFENSIEDLRKQVRMIREQGRDGWSWQQHLRSLCEDGTRTSMAGFLHRCPTFAGVDAEALLGIPEGVPCDPRDGWKLLKSAPWSRAKRKQMYQSDGWVVHLFAGDEKTSDSKAQSIMRTSFWQQALSGSEVLVEVDITATRSMDLNKQDGIFRVLAWAALTGRIKAVIGGPPRQAIPTPSQGARSQDQYIKELQLVVRMMALWYMAEEGRCKRWRQGLLQTPTVKPHVAFLLEHPEAKCREHVSLFQTSLWRMFALDALMGEVQLEINGKPTVLGGNLNLWHLQGGDLGAVGAQRWPLELVAHLVQALRAWRGLRSREGVLASLTRRSWMDLNEEAHVAKFDVKDWKLHLQRDHLPYRRDCRVCVERSSGRPHRRVRHPAAYVLSIDTAGPFRTKGVGGYKYLMVACYRLPRLAGMKSETDSLEQEESAVEPRAPEDGDDWLFEDVDEGGGVGPIVKDDGAEKPDDVREDGDDEDGEVEELKELAKPLEYMNLYMTRPLRTRTKAEALKVIQEFYIQLRSSGFPVNRLHMDRAREFQSAALEVWAASRDIEVTRTQGDDPLQNGAAERAVGYIKGRMRVLLSQAKDLSKAEKEQVRSWWPFAADTAAAQHQAAVMEQRNPSAARFGSRVFTKRKGYGSAGRTDLLPKWMPATYLGPARTVPHGHLVFTDEGNLWFTTNIRQFDDLREGDVAEEGDREPDPPPRRVRGKSSIGGCGGLPGLSALSALATSVEDQDADDESWCVVSDSPGCLSTSSAADGGAMVAKVGAENKAKLFTTSRRFSMEDCLEVLTSTEFLKTRKQRVSAWSSNEPPPVHTTLGAYQRGPFVGLTKATTRHRDLALYLNKFFKKQCGEELQYTSITVAKNLHTGVHCDRFNLRNSENTVITVGDFEGGGIWQEGVSPIHPTVEIEAPNGSVLKGFVQPVQNRVVKVDPKRLHMSMPWNGGTKWTLIAHTIGSKAKLGDDELETLQGLGFPYHGCSDQVRLASAHADLAVFEYEDQCLKDLSQENLHVSDGDDEWRCRYWTRRLLDEEEQLKGVVPPELASEFVGVDAANEGCLRYLELRENFVVHERRDVHQWMQLSRLVESEQEMYGVEMVLETLEGPLQVVYTVALDDVKQNITLWSEAIHKEAKALLDAGALVPMTAEEQRRLVATGNLVILPAKGVFTVKPPDDGVTVDGDGNPLPRGSPAFWKRKARLVICGNFQQKQAQEDSYAGGCQIDSLRAMLVFGMLKNWCFASTDIRNAFILAPIKDEEDEDQSEVYALTPPKVFQLARVPYSLQLWRVDRALYGFRRSPRLWSRFRDRRLKAARIPYGAGFLLLCQSRADANVWAITYVLDGEEEILGYLNIYVDDVLYVGQAQAIFAVQEWLTQDWKASELSWATSESSIRFLGLEIEASEGRVKISQCGYIKELLRHHDQAEGPGHATPCPPEWLVGDRVFDQVEHTEAQLRRAQVLTGELLWLSGRSRPDLMHAVATMSCLCLRNPLLVEKIGLRVLSYLRETLNYALVYQPTAEGHVLDAYSDASFSPQGEKSFGCCLVCFQGCPITWRAGRQSLVSLSVAEAELIETINASQLLSSTAAFTAELMTSEALLRINVDNAAAVALCSEAAGTWRTRHLKVRAWHLRESVRLQQVVVRHIPGLNQLADLGTKAFCKPRLQELQNLWNLRDRDERAGGVRLAAAEAEQHTSITTAPAVTPPTAPAANGIAGLLVRLVVFLGWLVQTSGASSAISRGSGLEVSFPWELYGLGVICLVAAIAIWEAIKWVCEWYGLRRVSSVSESRGARRLRKLQQAVQQEVERYRLDDLAADEPMTTLGEGPRTSRVLPTTSAPESQTYRSPGRMYRSTQGPEGTFGSARRSRMTSTSSVGVQTEDWDHGFRECPGPFIMSEHGDCIHHEPNCRGLRNAVTRRRQVTLCAYCQTRDMLYRRVG